jgi:rubrerythrin
MQDRFRELADGTFQCIVCATTVAEMPLEGRPVSCPNCAAVEKLETVRTPPFSPDELHPE